MLKGLYNLFSIVRIYELVFNAARSISIPLEPLVIPFLNWRLRPERPFIPKRGSTLQLIIRPDERAYVGWPVLKYILGPLIGNTDDSDTSIEKGPVSDSGPVNQEGTQITCGRLLIRLPLFILICAIALVASINSSPYLRDLFIPKGIPLLRERVSFSLQTLTTGNTLIIGIGVALTAALLTAMVLLIWLVGLVSTYWRYEWERRHTVFAFSLEGLLHLEAEFLWKAVGPFYQGDNKKVDTPTPVEEIMEIELVTDVEDLIGGEQTPAAQDTWSQYLSKKHQVQSIRIASRSGAPDILRSITLAPTTLSCISKIVDAGVAYKTTLRSFQAKEQEVLSGTADRESFDAKAGVREAEKVRDNFDRLYPQPIKRYPNAFALIDPGIWDRRSGERVEDAPSHPAAPDPTSVSEPEPVVPSSSASAKQVHSTERPEAEDPEPKQDEDEFDHDLFPPRETIRRPGRVSAETPPFDPLEIDKRPDDHEEAGETGQGFWENV